MTTPWLRMYFDRCFVCYPIRYCVARKHTVTPFLWPCKADNDSCCPIKASSLGTNGKQLGERGAVVSLQDHRWDTTMNMISRGLEERKVELFEWKWAGWKQGPVVIRVKKSAKAESVTKVALNQVKQTVVRIAQFLLARRVPTKSRRAEPHFQFSRPPDARKRNNRIKTITKHCLDHV